MFTSILLIVSGYYGIASLLLYQKEITQGLKFRVQTFLIKGSEHSTDAIHSDTIMGAISNEEPENLFHTPNDSYSKVSLDEIQQNYMRIKEDIQFIISDRLPHAA